MPQSLGFISFNGTEQGHWCKWLRGIYHTGISGKSSGIYSQHLCRNLGIECAEITYYQGYTWVKIKSTESHESAILASWSSEATKFLSCASLSALPGTHKKTISDLVPLVTADSWVSPPIKLWSDETIRVICDSPWLLNIDIRFR